MRKIRALPIGYSDVKEVIKTGYYVDKTAYAQELIEKQNPIFIARPRRFGKSLFIDTLATICSGEKEIFKNCHIGKPDNGYEWKQYPIIRLNFAQLNNDSAELLKLSFESLIKEVALGYGLSLRGDEFKMKLSNLITDMTKLGRSYAPKIVVLIDEYNLPIISLTKKCDLDPYNKVMRDFFMVLKAMNNCFKLTFVTGLGKFSLSQVFSIANHLDDITIDLFSEAICGFSLKEIKETFFSNEAYDCLAWNKVRDIFQSADQIIDSINAYYGGYKFHEHGTAVCSPWSILEFLKSGKMNNYWYALGNTDYLIKLIQERCNFDFQHIHEFKSSAYELLSSENKDEISLESFMFQTGYLTIARYGYTEKLYALKVPNKEIEESLQYDFNKRNLKRKPNYR